MLLALCSSNHLKTVDRQHQRLSPSASYFCLGKSNQNRTRRTLADAMKPHRCPALRTEAHPCASPASRATSAVQIVPDDLSPKRVRRPNSLRSDKGAFSPFSAAVLGELYGAGQVKVKVKVKVNGKGEGKGKMDPSVRWDDERGGRRASGAGGSVTPANQTSRPPNVPPATIHPPCASSCNNAPTAPKLRASCS